MGEVEDSVRLGEEGFQRKGWLSAPSAWQSEQNP